MASDHYELQIAARQALSDEYSSRFAISFENVDFTPPADGSRWLKFDYSEAESDTVSLDRKCQVFIGMVQVSIFFSPGTGIDSHRLLAKEIANFFYDGKMLTAGYVYEGGAIHPVQKSETGWFIPIRFYVRLESKRD